MGLEFFYGILTGMVGLIGIAMIDNFILKDKAIMKKVNSLKVYLFATFIEVSMFVIGYLVGRVI